MLELLYVEANEHLRETDKKRDQILIVTVTLSGAVFGFYEKLKVIPFGHKVALVILIIFLSIFLPFILITYRRWHIIYHLGARVLQQLMYLDNEKMSHELINELLKRSIRKPTMGHFIKTTETLIFNLFFFLNLSNVYILSCSFNRIPIVFMIGMFVVYLNINNLA